MREPLSTAYRTFLATADPSVWAECLSEAERTLERTPSHVDRINEGLCISVYTMWLCTLCGDSALAGRAKSAYGRFVKALENLGPQSPSISTDLGWGIVLGWSGYTGHARKLLGSTARERPEIALLVAPDSAPEKTAWLRPLVTMASGIVFPPAVYIFCGALIDLGATAEAATCLEESGLPKTDPQACELYGKIHERAGEWGQALAAYLRSSGPWPVLRLRAALCRIITEGSGSSRDFAGPDDKAELAKALARGESEIDQAEIARASAFVNACLWNPTDDWMVHFELGQLDFRRRRYSEADAHLRKSLTLAPEECRLPIAELRFTNLTWLTGSSHSRDLDMEPEAIESGNAALQFSPGQHASASTRVWLAEVVKDPALLPASVEEWDLSSQERAFTLAGNAPESLRCALDAFGASRDHRILLRLARTFNESGLERSVDYLLDLGTRESWNNFFELWEIAGFVFQMRSDLNESTGGFARVSQRILELADRLLELSEFNFQHLVRAYDLFSKMNWQDAAEEVLRRAGGLAEGAAENLSMAVARRKAEGFDPARSGRQGLEYLRKAERESRDRLEKLQIARELFYYGQSQQALGILENEAVFNPNTHLRPIEFIVVLQCKPWLKEEQYSRLSERAEKALDVDIASGAIGYAGDQFRTRLKDVLKFWITGFSNYGKAGAGVGKPPESLDNPEWKAWQAKLEAGDTAESVDRLSKTLEQDFGGPANFSARFCAWESIRELWKSTLNTSATRLPDVYTSEIPIARNYSFEEDLRAIVVSDLWRNYFSIADVERQAQVRARIEQFYAEEGRLLEQWEGLRRRGVEPLLRSAVICGEFAIPLLRSMVSSAELRHSHPLLRQLYECVAADCEALATSVGDTVRALEAELGGSPVTRGSQV